MNIHEVKEIGFSQKLELKSRSDEHRSKLRGMLAFSHTSSIGTGRLSSAFTLFAYFSVVCSRVDHFFFLVHCHSNAIVES